MTNKFVILPVPQGMSSVKFVDKTTSNLEKPNADKLINERLVYEISKSSNMKTPDHETISLKKEYRVYVDSSDKVALFNIEMGFEMSKKPKELMLEDIERLVTLHQKHCVAVLKDNHITFPNGETIIVTSNPTIDLTKTTRELHGQLKHHS